MWMMLRRRRFAFVILVMMVVLLCFLVFKEDGGVRPVRNTLRLQKEAIQEMHSDTYDNDNDDNDDDSDYDDEDYETDDPDANALDDKDDDDEEDKKVEDDKEHADIEQNEEGNKEENPQGMKVNLKPREEPKEGNEKENDTAKEKKEEEMETNKDVNKESGTNKVGEDRDKDEKVDKGTNVAEGDKGDHSGGKEEKKPSTGNANAPPIKDIHSAHLVILAYMRTGSSMTGRILQYSPDVFYWYEPLHSLERYYVTGGKPESKYRNKTMNEMFKASAMAGGNVSATAACDIARVYNLTLKDYFMFYGAYGTRLFHDCFITAATRTQWNFCVTDMTNFCRWKFNATAVKTIRLHMSRALEVMRHDPKVKVIHLVRDPRAVLLSRYRLGYADFDQLSSEASLLCRKYMEDLKLAPRPGDPMRERYNLVRYEDIAAAPLDHTRHLYKLMNMEPTEKVLNSIARMTQSAKKSKPCPTCAPVPLNSTEVSQAWRQTLTLEDAQTISKECTEVMKMLGYRVDFDNEAQLRDMRVSAVGPLKIV